MPLLKPLPGDLADRQSILELKIDHCDVDLDAYGTDEHGQPVLKSGKVQGVKSGKVERFVAPKGSTDSRVIAFVDEHQLILNAIEKNFTLDKQNDQAFVDKYDKLYQELAETNSALWTLEDQARILRAAPDKFVHAAAVRAAEVLFAITETNDKRAELMREINKMWNYNNKEKMYA
jgi:hypothetical protein